MTEINLKCKYGTKTIFTIFNYQKLLGTLPESLLRLSFPFKKNQFNYEVSEEELLCINLSIKKYSWQKMCKYLTRKDCSEWECFQYLKKIPIPDSLIKELINTAQKNRFIDDKRFAEIYTNSMISRGKSEKEISYKLKLKKVDEEIIRLSLKNNYNHEDKKEIITQKTIKMINKYKNLTKNKQKEKIIAYFFRKGFYYDEVVDIISNIFKDKYES